MLDLQKAHIAWQKVDDYALRRHLLSEVDPRVQLVLTFLFVFMIVLSSPHRPQQLLLFFPYILLQAKLVGMSLRWLVRRIAIILPFVLFIGIFSPWLERGQQFEVLGYSLSVGWLTLVSITLRAILCVSLGIILLASCGIIGISEGLRKLKFPKVFCLTLYFIYNYFSLLLQDMAQVQKAYLLRKFSKKQRIAWRDYQEILKAFFIRSWLRSNRIHQAMQCRGFDGRLYQHRKYDRYASLAWLGLSLVYLGGCYLFYVYTS
ncbi:energy-coupling factor transporter transmembrane component T family protein [Psychrobacter sp. I-STPA6b]|uniref:energy-coupling factor transporter transmembrane component T family protein n=1 Tax=Psychrobacter sp. I-STPA6b TaxID=2585718 RepID=UPI001D0CCB17|nr:energy-coupling factor transporter transmembrane component T [Psychrobacter sp. I-STPA6b]